MSQIRFHIAGNPSTEWIEEAIAHRQQGVPTAVEVMSRLRPQYPSAAITLERRGDIKIEKPQLFRYKILVKQGIAQVLPNPENPLGQVKLKDAILQSRAFQESERDKVIAEIQEQFPDAQLISETI